ncbi:MAG: hypothetical protein ABWY23_04935 [Mycetocola sp.]
MAEELAPPLAYSAVWLWIFLSLSVMPVLFVAVNAVRRYITRRWRQGSRLTRLKRDFVARIESVEKEYDSGRVSGREAHAALSALVRGFVAEVAPLQSDRMTLRDLENQDAAEPLVHAVRRFYGGAFPAEPEDSVSHSTRQARAVVAEWN